MHAGTIIIGGGTAGCVLAHRLSADETHPVVLIEAGPDFGPNDSGRWPDAIHLANLSVGHHDWGYQTRLAGRSVPYPRGKVMGGSSATNLAGVSMGLRQDYDRWGEANPGWGFDDLLPYFRAVERLENDGAPLRGRDGMLPVQRLPAATPLLADVAVAAAAAGIPASPDVTGPDTAIGMGGVTRNIRGPVRFSSAAAYLDPARGRPNLTILADTTAVDLELDGARVTGVRIREGNTTRTITADRVVLAAGAIGSPILLQRSGIGDPTLIENSLGRSVVHALPGVGKNLLDHHGVFMANLLVPGAVERLLEEAPAESPLGRSAMLIRVASDPALEAHDHDVLCFHPLRPSVERAAEILGWRVFLVTPQSAGSVAAASVDPDVDPRIETGFGADADVARIAGAVAWVRELTAHPKLAPWLEREVTPGARARGADLAGWIRENIKLYFHPVGSCKLGPASDPMAVVGADGRVHGIDNLYVADASVMPSIPRGMIILTVYAIAEKVAAGLT